MCGIVLVALALSGAGFSQNGIAELRQRFAQESDPVRKAKKMPRLGEAEFKQIQKNVSGEQFTDALALLRQYRGEVRSCVQGLDATGVNAVKHSSGFRQLQISLRESLRRLDTMIPLISPEAQSGFIEERSSLNEMNKHLIEELFPGPNQPPTKPRPPREEEHH
ncbi:MAG TPA: hypothetical protein VI216_01735 [Candidatus Acidoferrales bacterium]